MHTRVYRLPTEIVELFREELVRGLGEFRLRVRSITSSETGELHQIRINVPRLNSLFPSDHIQESASIFLSYDLTGEETGFYPFVPKKILVATELYGLPSDVVRDFNPRIDVGIRSNRIKTGAFNYEIVDIGKGQTLVIYNGSYDYEKLPDSAKSVAVTISKILDLYETPKADENWKNRIKITEYAEKVLEGSLRKSLEGADFLSDEEFEGIALLYAEPLHTSGKMTGA